MKVLHISSSDISGGAARGAYWLHQALLQGGVDSRMFVADKRTHDEPVIACQDWSEVFRRREALDAQVRASFPNRKDVYFSPASFTPDSIAEQINRLEPDIINLHWVAGGLLMPEVIPHLRGRLVWTLRDMWPFTGGCHYSEGCQGYVESCGACPLLKSEQPLDVTRSLWQRKHDSWKSTALHLVAVSRWMASCAEASSLFRGRPIEVIHNGISMEIFTPRGKEEARKLLEIPPHKKIILFGALSAATDTRKGFHYLQAALKHLGQEKALKDTELLIFGASRSDLKCEDYLPTRYLGSIQDDLMLSRIYSAADVTVAPSLEDACPKVPIESMACGTPVACFDATGMIDIVDHRGNGYRARAYVPEDLALGIEWILQDPARWQSLSKKARQKVETGFSRTIQAKKYTQLYQKILSGKAD